MSKYKKITLYNYHFLKMKDFFIRKKSFDIEGNIIYKYGFKEKTNKGDFIV